METIIVTAHFHTAHRQKDFPGHCSYVHGHTWRGRITVRCEEFPLDKHDVSLDFGDLKHLLRRMDHRILVTDADTEFLDPAVFDQEGVYHLEGRGPSVENVARHVCKAVVDLIGSKYPGRGIDYEISVQIQETDNNLFLLEKTARI